MRRSLTITPENERRIQGLRSVALGLETPVDLDYTTTTNLLVEVGFLVLEEFGKGRPVGGSVAVDGLSLSGVLANHFATAMLRERENVEDRRDFLDKAVKSEGVLKGLVRALRNLSEFQPKESRPKETAPGKS